MYDSERGRECRLGLERYLALTTPSRNRAYCSSRTLVCQKVSFVDISDLVPASDSQSGPAPGHDTFDLPLNKGRSANMSCGSSRVRTRQTDPTPSRPSTQATLPSRSARFVQFARFWAGVGRKCPLWTESARLESRHPAQNHAAKPQTRHYPPRPGKTRQKRDCATDPEFLTLARDMAKGPFSFRGTSAAGAAKRPERRCRRRAARAAS
jgi:hypothetical protein